MKASVRPNCARSIPSDTFTANLVYRIRQVNDGWVTVTEVRFSRVGLPNNLCSIHNRTVNVEITFHLPFPGTKSGSSQMRELTDHMRDIGTNETVIPQKLVNMSWKRGRKTKLLAKWPTTLAVYVGNATLRWNCLPVNFCWATPCGRVECPFFERNSQQSDSIHHVAAHGATSVDRWLNGSHRLIQQRARSGVRVLVR